MYPLVLLYNKQNLTCTFTQWRDDKSFFNVGTSLFRTLWARGFGLCSHRVRQLMFRQWNWCLPDFEFIRRNVKLIQEKILDSFKWWAEKRFVALKFNSYKRPEHLMMVDEPPLKWILNIIQNRIWAATE